MKLLFLGDSITDAGRNRETDGLPSSYGYGFVRSIADRLLSAAPSEYVILNRGISANKTVDLYARIKMDVWNEKPDVLTILVGINDLAFDIKLNAGVGRKRFEKVYRAILEETVEILPGVRMILMEPFMLPGTETNGFFKAFTDISAYAAVVEKLAEETGAAFVPLAEVLQQDADRYGAEKILFDGVHPALAGAERIADEWMKTFVKMKK